MERDDRRYHREFERKLHNEDRSYNHNNRAFGTGDYDRNNNSNRDFENYRDRYDNHRGNYYGMSDDDYAYRNVRSTGSTAYGSGPVGGYGASSYRGVTDSNDQDNYRYGDPNPYMNNNRNGGYESSRGTGWDRHDSYGTTDNNRSTNYSSGRDDRDYSRQNNSYQYGGQGRRYSDFNRDENRKMNSGEDSGFNMLGIDAYTDRGDRYNSYTDNNYRGDENRNSFYEGHYNNSESMNRGSIRNSGSSNNDNYATGLYASNRAYNSDQRNNDNDNDYDYSQRSSRYRKPGETSGPDYGADSGAGDYGYKTTRA